MFVEVEKCIFWVIEIYYKEENSEFTERFFCNGKGWCVTCHA